MCDFQICRRIEREQCGLLKIEVVEVRGHCPVHEVGDKIAVDDPQIVLEKTDALCTHALSSLLHYVVALERGADPVELGLSKPKNGKCAYIQCVDPGEPYTRGGTVIFKVCRIERRGDSK
jgi:uncharacterized repeat protein (TIGR04076 family)